MAEILDMNDGEMKALLARVGYGHLGCTRHGTPYVVPVHYSYSEPDIYIYTTEGMKTEFIAENPQVCLQVEDVTKATDWRSVIVQGNAKLLTEADDKLEARGSILAENPALQPALAHSWVGDLARPQREAVYKVSVHHMSGKKTI